MGFRIDSVRDRADRSVGHGEVATAWVRAAEQGATVPTTNVLSRAAVGQIRDARRVVIVAVIRAFEISQAGVNACVGVGLSVIQGDADTDLVDYPAAAFDYAIPSQTLQATRDPRGVLAQLVRIARHAIVSFPNFGHWRMRWHLLTRGTMPVTPSLPEPWYSTPNIHLCTIKDFLQFCAAEGIVIERAIAIDGAGRAAPIRSYRIANLTGEQGLFLLSRR